MDWAQRMNRAMDYVEAHLMEDLDERALARTAACGEAAFRGTFSQVTGMTFADYVRRRRLTLAACELQRTNVSVLETALKYGYDSPDAFRVAFRRMHGILPSQARVSGATLAFQCKLRFEFRVRGINSMEVRMEHRDAFRVVGVRRTTPYGGGTWAVIRSDGSADRIRALSGKFFDLGLCFGFGPDGSNDYMCAIQWDGDPGGFEVYEYPASDWACFMAVGRISENALGETWRRINEEFLPASGMVKGGTLGLPTIERYILWDEAADRCEVEILCPVDCSLT